MRYIGIIKARVISLLVIEEIAKHKIYFSNFFPSFFFCRHRNYGNVLFNDALNTYYLRLYGVRHMVKDHSDSEKGNPLPPYHMGYSFRLTARVILYVPSHRQDSTYHGLCFTCRGALARTRNSRHRKQESKGRQRRLSVMFGHR